jgi:pantothenate kinase type III
MTLHSWEWIAIVNAERAFQVIWAVPVNRVHRDGRDLQCAAHVRIFAGGLIAPGIGTTINALASNASQLPVVDFGPPDSLVARDTVNALKSGFFYGWISMVEGIVARIEEEYGIDFSLILTGGYASRIAPTCQGKRL